MFEKIVVLVLLAMLSQQNENYKGVQCGLTMQGFRDIILNKV